MKQTITRLLPIGTLALALVCVSCGGPEESELATAQNLEVGTTGTLTVRVTATDENGTPLPSGSYNVAIHARYPSAPGPVEYTELGDGQQIAVVVDYGGLRAFQWVTLRKGIAYTVDTTGPEFRSGNWPMLETTDTTIGDRAEIFIRFQPLRVRIDATDENDALLPDDRYTISFGGTNHTGHWYYGRNEPAPYNLAIAHHGQAQVRVTFGGLTTFQTVTFISARDYIVDTTGPTAYWGGNWPISFTDSAPQKEALVHVRFLPLRVRIDATDETGTPLPDNSYTVAFGGTSHQGRRYYGLDEPAPYNITIAHHGKAHLSATFGGLGAFQANVTFISARDYVVDTTGPEDNWGKWPMPYTDSAPPKEAHFHVRFLPLRVRIDATDEAGTPLPDNRYTVAFGGTSHQGRRYYGPAEPAPYNLAIAHHGRQHLSVNFGGLVAFQTVTFKSARDYIVDTTGPDAKWGNWPMPFTDSAPQKEAHVHVRFLPLTLVVEAVTPDIFHIPHNAWALGSPSAPGPLYFKRLTSAPSVTHHGNFTAYVAATEGPQAGFGVYQSFVAKERQRYTIDATQGGNYWGNWPVITDTLSYGKTLVVRVIFQHAYGLQSVPALSHLLSTMDPEHAPLPLQIPIETESMDLAPAEAE